MASQGANSLFAENVYLVRGALLGADLAAALGQPLQAATLATLAAATDGVLTAQFFNASLGVWVHGGPVGDSPLFGAQNTNALALAVALGGAVTANATETTIKNAMATDVEGQGYHPTCGVASCRWVLQGLSAANLSTLALDMATQGTSPGWAYMVNATDMPGTLWEVWAGNSTDSAGGSKNHAMLGGGIGLWLYENALGLRFTYGLLRQPAATRISGGSHEQHLPCKHLSFDPKVRWGLPDTLARAVCAVSQELAMEAAFANGGASSNPSSSSSDKGPIVSLPALEERIHTLHTKYTAATAAVQSQTPPSTNVLVPTLTLAPDAALIRVLGSAAGYFDAPSGRCELSWRSGTTSPVFSLNASAPWGVAVRLALPLSILKGGGGVKVGSNGPDSQLSGGEGRLALAESVVAAKFGCGDQLSSLPSLRISGEEFVWCVRGDLALPKPTLASAAEVEGVGRQWGGAGVGTDCTWEGCSLMFEWKEGGLREFGLFVFL